jgi:hypothetical protein
MDYRSEEICFDQQEPMLITSCHKLLLQFITHSSQLKKINQACLPIAYAPSFYQELVSKNPKDGLSLDLRQHLSKFAYWNGFAVGAICSKIEGIKDW